METTARGFKIYDRIETERGEVRVQESSAVDRHVWIFQGDQAVHVNPDEARRVMLAIGTWLREVGESDAR